MSTAKRIIPLFDRILVRKVKPVEKTATGILIPEKSQESLNRGVVVAVGPGTKEEKTTLQAGDNVLLPTYGGTAIKEAAEEFFLFRESEILAKIQE